MSALGKKQARDLLDLVREARRAATMERMHVGSIYATQHADRIPIAVNEETLDDLIRERTRLYRDTWIVSPLDEVIEQLEAAAK